MKKRSKVEILENNSPWLAQLKRIRKLDTLNKNHKTDILIVGGGIAGITTAFFILKNTKKNVTVIEANKIAHGATGHNAGQIASYFEKPFSELVKEYGLKLATDAQKNILSAWNLLQQICIEAKIKTPVSQFTGYAGCTEISQLETHLENKLLRKKGGIEVEIVFISDKFNIKKLKKKYKGFYEVIPEEQLLNLLETNDKKYIAALGSKKGLTNSAIFTEELAGFLLFKYKDRFRIFEHSKIDKITLKKTSCNSSSNNFNISSKKVILCTNGFENLNIENKFGKEINSKFHDNVYGLIGYMAGYTEKKPKEPTAISYFPKSNKQLGFEDEDSYFYLTRRKFNINNENKNLICIGGPEKKLDESQDYIRERPTSKKAIAEIKEFLKKSYKNSKNLQANFNWHGLMGYTKTRVRTIGPEPRNKNLLYNLGCNGVGILPSIYGAKKITLFLQNKVKQKSIFDPQK